MFEHTVAGKTTTSENKQPFSLEGSSPWLPCELVLGAGSVCQVFLPQRAGGRVEYMRVEFFSAGREPMSQRLSQERKTGSESKKHKVIL